MSGYIMNCSHKLRLNSNINGCFIPRKNKPADQCTHYNPLAEIKPNSLLNLLIRPQSFNKMNLFPSTVKLHQNTSNVLH